MRLITRRCALVLLLVLIAAAIAVAVWFRHAHGDVRYAELDGVFWDAKTNACVKFTLRVDDPGLLAELEHWRDASQRAARAESWRRMLGRFGGQPRCQNALRQPLEQLTLVYDDGHRHTENVNVYQTPLCDRWRAARAQPARAAAEAAQ